MIITVETNNLIPCYLAQIALAIWHREHIGVVWKTLPGLEVHELKYSASSASECSFNWTPFWWLELDRMNFHMMTLDPN